MEVGFIQIDVLPYILLLAFNKQLQQIVRNKSHTLTLDYPGICLLLRERLLETIV